MERDFPNIDISVFSNIDARKFSPTGCRDFYHQKIPVVTRVCDQDFWSNFDATCAHFNSDFEASRDFHCMHI